jgi:F-type H+-transporting ATPase subunit a
MADVHSDIHEVATTATSSLVHATTEAAHSSGIHVALAPEVLGTLWGIPITNTLITSWVVMALLIGLTYFFTRRPQMIPGRVQFILEFIVTYVYDFMRETLENDKVARTYLPLLCTFFIFIATSNLLEFTPGIGSIGIVHGDGLIPIFRSVNTDLNVTLALAIIAVIMIEVAGVAALGFFKYAGKFINFSGHSISQRILNFVVGLIELVSEVSRLVSFSFRLFGNIFAGEVLLAVVAFFVPYILPVPLMAFELFVGLIQGAVFALLTLFFIKLAIMDPHAEEH